MGGRVGSGFKEARIALKEKDMEYKVDGEGAEECEGGEKSPILSLLSYIHRQQRGLLDSLETLHRRHGNCKTAGKG